MRLHNSRILELPILGRNQYGSTTTALSGYRLSDDIHLHSAWLLEVLRMATND